MHNRQEVGATQESADTSMDKQNVVHPYNGVLFGLKKEIEYIEFMMYFSMYEGI